MESNAHAQTAEPAADPVLATNTAVSERQKKGEGEKPRGFHWDNHPSFHFGPGTYVDFRARVQLYLRDSAAAVGDASAFDAARRRIGLEGRIGGRLDFQIEQEIGDADPWRDVFVDYREFAILRVQGGKFKLPFCLDENIGAGNQDFVYRSRAATQLAPGRDRGVMAHGRVARDLLRYELGWFDHDGRNARTANVERVTGGLTTAGRLSLQPFRTSRTVFRDLHVAVAFTDSRVPEGVASLRGRTALDQPFFPSDFWVKGSRRREGLEMRWRPGPFSVTSEYIRVTTDRRGQSVEDGDLPPIVARGWYVSGTWLATGESKAKGVDNPRHPLLRGGIGALEIAGRLENLAFGSSGSPDEASTSPRAYAILGNADRVATAGLNWYPYRGIKVQWNVIRESIADPSRGPLPSRPTFWSRVVRLQFTL
jgi:phosphate-selective porin